MPNIRKRKTDRGVPLPLLQRASNEVQEGQSVRAVAKFHDWMPTKYLTQRSLKRRQKSISAKNPNPTGSSRFRTHLMKMKLNTALCAWRATPGPRRSGCSVAPVKPGHTRTAQMEVPFTPATTVNLINSGVLF